MYTCSRPDRYEYDLWDICIEATQEKTSMTHYSIEANMDNLFHQTRDSLIYKYELCTMNPVVGEMLRPCNLHLCT